MGTTQRIIPGVSGEPNWRNLNIAITALGNNIDQEITVDLQLGNATERLNKNPSRANQRVVDDLNHRKTVLQKYINRHYRSAMANLVKTGGGGTKIATGKSSSLGKAGLRNALRIAGFVGGVHQIGLVDTLKHIGLGNLKGKSIQV